MIVTGEIETARGRGREKEKGSRGNVIVRGREKEIGRGERGRGGEETRRGRRCRGLFFGEGVVWWKGL